MVLPIVTSNIRETLEEIFKNPNDDWKKEMVHHLKEDNPEINTLLLGIAQDSSEAKKIIMAGYLVYKALELAEENESFI